MGQRALVVDDDHAVSDVVRRYLERAGLAVELAADGPSGWPPSTRTGPTSSCSI
jgi:DNA-binding response OmpR family regulator